MISERISDNIPPQMKTLNMVISILMHYYIFFFKKTASLYFVAPIRSAAASCINRLPAAYIHLSTNGKRRYVMTSGFRQYIAGYTCANLRRFPIRRRVAFASALEYNMDHDARKLLFRGL